MTSIVLPSLKRIACGFHEGSGGGCCFALYAKFRRIELKRTVKDCARAAHLNPANYTHIEKGRMIATAAELAAIAKVLGVTDPNQLLVHHVSAAPLCTCTTSGPSSGRA